ncbi:MAG: hypothetical protein U0835_19845 [Isosphaeraceae bacterium]
MSHRIFEALGPVRRRQRWDLMARWGAAGLLVSSLAVAALGVAQWVLPRVEFPGLWVASVVLAGPAAGALLALVRVNGWRASARAVDAQYGLKDRTLTAVEFAARPPAGGVHELQLADAEAHLARLDARKVTPLRVPRVLPFSLGAFAAALVILGLTPLFRPRPAEAKVPAPLERVVAAAEEARENLDDLDKLAKKEKDPQLEKLVQELFDKISEMKQPGVDVKDALAKLSEMQAAIAAQQAQFNVGLVDAQMQSLGEALASTQALESAGQALQQGKYEQAAESLEQAEPKFDRKEAKTLKDKLKKSAKQMAEAGLAELSEATTEMADSVDDEGTCQGAAKKLGKLARAQGRRKAINDLLSLQCQNLSECKSNCQKNSTAKFTLRKKSENPSSNWGMSTSGNTDGEKTKLDSARNRDTVKGQMGEGPSESETSHSPEGRQTASRQYRDNYQKYRKMTEAALNSEPIPLGHRETIRRYFELIRPQEDEARAADPAAAKANPAAEKPAGTSVE